MFGIKSSARRGKCVAPLIGGALLLCSLTVSTVFAQAYPSKLMKFIIPFAPGGSTDIAGRLVASEMSSILGQPIVVENRAGAAGNIGIEAVVRSSPDGHTFGFSGMGPSVLTHIAGPKPPFGLKELIFAGHGGLVELMIVGHSGVAYGDIRQLVMAAKASPGKISYAHGGTGSPAHLAFELFKSMAGVDMPAISYKGDGPAVIDIVGGQVVVGSISVAGAMAQVQAGKLKAIAVGSPVRSPALPNIPTVAEAGIPGYEAGTFNMVVLPAGTPSSYVDRLNAALNETMRKPVVRDRYIQLGIVPVINTPQQAADFVSRELAKWARVIRDANIQMQ